MGVAYISNCTAKPINTFKSLYLVVSDDIIIPRPKPMPAIINTSIGINTREKPIFIVVPLNA